MSILINRTNFINEDGGVMESTRYGQIQPYELRIRKKLQKVIENKEKKMTAKERELLREIEEVYKEMAVTLNHFNYSTHPDLIEYYVYQYKAAQIKHDYLLRSIKELYYGNSC